MLTLTKHGHQVWLVVICTSDLRQIGEPCLHAYGRQRLEGCVDLGFRIVQERY